MAGVAPRLVLASASPRRVSLLAQVGVECETAPADIDETPVQGESAAAMVERLAIGKASHIAAIRTDDVFVVGGDTTVAVNGQILGKPENHADAERMLGELNGQRHQVISGIAIVAPDSTVVSDVDISSVWMRALSSADISWYLQTGEHHGKAGAYAIQGAASVFVERIEGDYNSIVGLPLAALDRLMSRFGHHLRDFR